MSPPIIHDCEQGSPEWFRCRMGLPTSSEFACLLAKGKGGGESKTRRTYLRKLAGEIITGQPMENYTNAHMERGKAMEAEARDFYAFLRDAELKPVGFIQNGRTGCSPDALVGEDGILEIKTAFPHIGIEAIEGDAFPSEHYAQCQGALMVTGRKWCDLTVYWPNLPVFIKRAIRDEQYIADLAKSASEFNAELDALVKSVRSYGKAA